MSEPRFLDSWSEVSQHLNRLPHWQQDGRTYFVTFHLADSIPREKLEIWHDERREWRRWNPAPWTVEQQREYSRKFGYALDRWLDAGQGACVFRSPPAARILAEAFQRFDAEHYELHAWVVMPNHAHVLFSTTNAQSHPECVRRWKGRSSRLINTLLGGSGALWHKDYYDRMIRDEGHFYNCASYIRHNPVRARLPDGQFSLHESDRVRSLLGEATLVACASREPQPLPGD